VQGAGPTVLTAPRAAKQRAIQAPSIANGFAGTTLTSIADNRDLTPGRAYLEQHGFRPWRPPFPAPLPPESMFAVPN